jgi:hypothetical protein
MLSALPGEDVPIKQMRHQSTTLYCSLFAEKLLCADTSYPFPTSNHVLDLAMPLTANTSSNV